MLFTHLSLDRGEMSTVETSSDFSKRGSVYRLRFIKRENENIKKISLDRLPTHPFNSLDPPKM